MFGGVGEEDDADFLSPTGGARLASLFGLDQTEAGTGNEFFQYTAPKQPKKGQPAAAAGPPPQKPPTPTPASAIPSVFIATAVHAYRFANGQYVKQGKFGAAVVGSHSTKEYRILLYINQQQQVASARVHPGFVLTVQPNNYSTFYDDQRQNWSIMFESEKAAADFSQQLCIAKYNSGPSPSSVLFQDLVVGEGQGVEVGDSLEVAFTGWLFQNGGLGQVFDSTVNKDKLLRLKLGSGKVIKGWEEGMVGLKKGGRRFLLVPPALAYGPQGVASRIPPDSTLAFEVEVKRVRLAKDAAANGQSLGPRDSPAPSPGPNLENLTTGPAGPPPSALPPKPGEPAVRAKSNSISEQLANPDVAKAKLISRMAKMGQPMLPFLSGTAPAQLDSSDSEMEPYTAMTYAYPQATAAASQLQPVGPLYPAPFQAAGDISSFLMTEARQQNTEIRLAVGKVADKMDRLVAKNSGHQLLPGISSVTMETAMIMSNIQRIIQENERLKQEVFEKSSRVEEQNEKISELIDRNQRYVEQSNLLMEQRNTSLQLKTEHTQARVLHAEQEKVKVAEELAAATAQISRLQLELTGHQKEEMDLRSQLNVALKEAERHGSQLSQLQAQLAAGGLVLWVRLGRFCSDANLCALRSAELQESSQDARHKFQAEKQSRRQLEGKVAALEEELADLRAEKENLEKNLSKRKKKALLERGQAAEELEELRRAHQEELDKLRQSLKKARTSTGQAASEELSLLQAELDSQWEARCERMVAAAKEQHMRQFQEVCEQRDAQQQRISQLEGKLSLLKTARSSEDEKLLALQERLEQLEPAQAKASVALRFPPRPPAAFPAPQLDYVALQAEVAALKTHYEERIQELGKGAERPPTADSTEEVKQIMNGVFRSLRGQFELEESYTGRAVLGVVVNTIKTVTLQLLQRQEESSGDEEGPEPAEGQPPSPAAPAAAEPGGRRPPAPPAAAPPPAPARCPEGESAGPPPLSPAGGHDSATPEAHTAGGEALLSLGPSPRPRSGLEPPEEEGEMVRSGPAGEGSTAGPAEGAPAGDGTAHEAEGGPTVPSGGGGGLCPDAPNLDSGVSSPAADLKDSTAGQPEAASSPPGANTSHSEDEGKSSKPAGRQPSTPGGPLEEDEEEELSMKGRPPPTPLFADDEDDDELDWLG
ncbi:hypothetical protein lerEdw1_015258 [Lerista edwardsae]|nr:hypothetical protein lerEdw1_015258 [Lerista edwardsae]